MVRRWGVSDVLCPLSLPLQCQNKAASEVGYTMAKRKLKKNPKDTSSVVGQKEMTQTEQHHVFSLAAVALLVAVCVVPPLRAEISTCKYTGLLTSKN